MKKLLIAVASFMSLSTVMAGEPYYVVQRGIVDSSVITIYGYPDNKTPCIFLEKYMNKAMEEERNYHRFSCVDGTTAMVTDCKSEKNEEYNCLQNWKIRNE